MSNVSLSLLYVSECSKESADLNVDRISSELKPGLNVQDIERKVAKVLSKLPPEPFGKSAIHSQGITKTIIYPDGWESTKVYKFDLRTR